MPTVVSSARRAWHAQSAWRLALLPAAPLSSALLLAALLLLAATVLLTGCSGERPTSPAPEGPVEIHVRWVTDSLPYGTTVEIFEPLPADRMGETASYRAGALVPTGAPLADGVLHTRWDEPRRFVIVLRTRSPEAFRFWVAPHLALPIEAESDLVITCLCTGELYEVPAGGSWRRVVEYGLSRRSPVRGPLSITHVFTRGELPLAGD